MAHSAQTEQNKSFMNGNLPKNCKNIIVPRQLSKSLNGNFNSLLDPGSDFRSEAAITSETSKSYGGFMQRPFPTETRARSGVTAVRCTAARLPKPTALLYSYSGVWCQNCYLVLRHLRCRWLTIRLISDPFTHFTALEEAEIIPGNR
jgi:hypothetical protein